MYFSNVKLEFKRSFDNQLGHCPFDDLLGKLNLALRKG